MKKKEENIFQILSQKPWDSSQAAIDNNHDGKNFAKTKENLGVKTIMTVSTVIFSLFIVAYSDRMLVHDWRSMPEPGLLWVNTAILILQFTTPVAVTSYLLAERFNRNPDDVASLVIISTLMSVLYIPLILSFLI